MATKLGPWPIGLDNLTPDVDLPPQALRVADDVLIDENGTVTSGPAPRPLYDAPGLAGLWTSEHGETYGVLGSDAVRVTLTGVESLGDIGADGHACFLELAGRVLACSRTGLFALEGGQFEPLGYVPPAFQVAAAPYGGLDEGRYGVAVAALEDGEEFALSGIQFVDVPAGGGLLLNVSGTGQVRIYRTHCNGGELYRATDAPAGLPDYLVGTGTLGALPTGRNLDLMPGGQIAQAWKGRVLVANGRTLYYSQPMRPALCDLRHNFTRFPSVITMVAPVHGGVFVADRSRVYFLEGADPEQWTIRQLTAGVPVEGAYALVPGSLFPEVPDMQVAVWLAEGGFVLGLPDGGTASPQDKRLKLKPDGKGCLVLAGRRLYAIGA